MPKCKFAVPKERKASKVYNPCVKIFNAQKYLSLQSRFGNNSTKSTIDRSPITVLYTVIFLKVNAALGRSQREAL